MPDQPYHHGDLKTQLIAEGLTLLNAEGYEKFSLRKVAARCGVSQTAPYRHFANKDELIAAITHQALEAFGQSLTQAVNRHPGAPSAQLAEMGVAYVRFFAAYPEYLRLLFLSDISLRKRFTAIEKECYPHGTFRILDTVVAAYQASCPQDTRTHDEMVLYSWGLVHGIATLLASGELENNEETLRQAERVIRGIV